jgi:hypothetical protein
MNRPTAPKIRASARLGARLSALVVVLMVDVLMVGVLMVDVLMIVLVAVAPPAHSTN